jgi:hypothetical protein
VQLSEVRKTVINVATLIVSIGSLILGMPGIDLWPAQVAAIVSLVVAVAGAVLHYLVPNTTADPARAAGRSVALKQP